MGTADIKTAVDGASIGKQPEPGLYPFMEMVPAEVKSINFETEGADRDQCGVSIATLRLSALIGKKSRRDFPS